MGIGYDTSEKKPKFSTITILTRRTWRLPWGNASISDNNLIGFRDQLGGWQIFLYGPVLLSARQLQEEESDELFARVG
jgi:hypothetical protein